MPAMKEPALQRAHDARIEPVDDANSDALIWLYGGIAGMGIGIGTAAVIQEESGAGAAVAGITGLVLGIGGLIAGLAVMPSADEELAAEARRHLFLPKEDDMGAVGRGVDRANADQRTRCGGNPVPFTRPAAESQKRAAPAKAPGTPRIAPIELHRRRDDEAAPPPPTSTAPNEVPAEPAPSATGETPAAPEPAPAPAQPSAPP
jgi:hypothetical protein